MGETKTAAAPAQRTHRVRMARNAALRCARQHSGLASLQPCSLAVAWLQRGGWLDDASAQHVVHVESADDLVVVIGHDHGVNLLILHDG